MPRNPEQNQGPEAQEAVQEKIERNRSVIRSILFAGILTVAGVTVMGIINNTPDTHPNEWNEAEKIALAYQNSKLPNGKMSKWGEKFPPGIEFADDDLVFLELPGSRMKRRLRILKVLSPREAKKNKKKENYATDGETHVLLAIDREMESPQMVRIPEHCVPWVWRIVQEVKRRWGTVPRINFVFRMSTIQRLLTTEVKAGPWGPHVRQDEGKCVMDVSFQDAFGRAPYGVDEDGNLLFVEDMPEETEEQKAVKKMVSLEHAASVNGMHILIREILGKLLGIRGGNCADGVPRDLWHLMQGKALACPHDEAYERRKEALLANPPGSFDDFAIREYLEELWDAPIETIKRTSKQVYKKGKKVVEGAVKIGENTIRIGKRIYHHVFD